MRISCPRSPLRTLAFSALFYFLAPPLAHTQSQSPYLFASIPGGRPSNVAAFSVDPSGILTAVPGSPFPESQEGGLVAIDPLNQFVFILNSNSNSISVFSIDAATGALSELTAAGSPFSAPAPQSGGVRPSSPTCMATFQSGSGNYLYVAYRYGPAAFTGAIVQFQIGTKAQPLTPISTTRLDATPLDLAVSPQGYLYAALQLVPNSNLGNQTPGIGVFAIDPTSGQLQPNTRTAAANLNERSLAINPTGTFLFDGWGTSPSGDLESSPILSDGSAFPSPAVSPIALTAPNSPPSALLVDGTGKFLYVRQGAQTVVYSIDPVTGALSTPSATVPQLSLSQGNTAADPIEPYLYTLQSGQVQVFRIDLDSGALMELGSPYVIADGGGSSGLAITNSFTQSIPGIAAGLAPLTLNFPDTTVTQPSPVELIHLTNTGTQPLDVNLSSIAITGADAPDFALTQSCQAQLQPPSSCTFSIAFTPSVAGARQATLIVTDAAGTQSAQLLGTGVSGQSAVTLAPPSLTFSTTPTGSTSASQTVTLTNSGATTLHISSILPGGQNPADFPVASGPNQSGVPPACAPTSYAPNASCSITVAFSPLGAGARSASIIIADDAPGSTQTILLSGTGTGAPAPGPLPSARLSATSLSFLSASIGEQTPQQSITITSATAAPLHISSLQLTGPNASDFILNNGCTAPAYLQNQSCTASLTFTASAFGSRVAKLVVTDDDPSSPQSITLAGSVQPETLTISPTDSNAYLQAISAGQTATFKLQLTATFNGTVSFSPCSGAPATATCIVPTPISVTGDQSTVPFTITVATTAASSSTFLGDERERRPIPRSDLNEILFPCALPIAVALALFFVSLRDHAALRARPAPAQRSVPRVFAIPIPASVTATALLAFSIFSIAGCGGASTIATAPTVTPTSQSQTYTITITPTATTSDGLPVPNVQPIHLTLVVN